MHRADVLYVGMIAVLVLGLWAIIAAGSDLRAPYDLSGAWVLCPEGSPAARQKVRISQSGRFVRMQSEALGSLRLLLPEDAAKQAEGAVLTLAGAQPIMVRIPSRKAAEYRFQVGGITYVGKRIAPRGRDGSQSERHG